MSAKCQWCGQGNVHDGLLTKQNLLDLQSLVSHPGWEVYVAFARHMASLRTQWALDATPDERERFVAEAKAWIERTNMEADLEQAISEMVRQEAEAGQDAPTISYGQLATRLQEA